VEEKEEPVQVHVCSAQYNYIEFRFYTKGIFDLLG